MTKLQFFEFADYKDESEEGKIAYFETTGDLKIPLNIFIDNFEEVQDFEEGLCTMDICGIGLSSDLEVYESEETYLAAETGMAPISLIPCGTFPVEANAENFSPSPHIIFTGVVKAVEKNPDPASEDADYCLLIETLEIELILYVWYDGEINVGNIIHDMAWLYGNIVPC